MGLAAIQTVWVRFHNFIVDKLPKRPKQPDANIAMQEARRVTTAMYLHIVYNEYLPLLIGCRNCSLSLCDAVTVKLYLLAGKRMMRKFKLRPKRQGYTFQYDKKLDPAVSNVFATAAFRFGLCLSSSWHQRK